ncbi:RYamide receptor-like isoform X2 [Lineus longissimus]|uniref:RYamide receptor-like isoform X2 n=1 Tax=Lineus longissimus TaxID=88925 RepID=UPI00315D9414
MLATTVRSDFMATYTPDTTPVSGSGEGGQPPYDLPSMLPSNNQNSTEGFYNVTLLRTSNSTPGGDLDPGGISSASQVTVIVVYTIAIVLSFVGNMLVIIVFSCGKRSRTDLRGFLISLAVSDLIQGLFCMPFSFTSIMLQRWIFTAPMCPIVLFMQLTSVTASVCTNMAIGMDRFWVVMFPLRSRLTKSRYKIVISVIWLISLALSSVQLYVGRAVPQTHYSAALDCSENWPNETWTRGYTIFILVITYIIPLSILTFTYSFVGKKLWQRTAPGNADEARDTQQLRSKRKVIKMLVVVVVLFGICWLPLHLFMILLDFVFDPSYAKQQGEILQPLYFAFHWLAMSNSFVNPIIYGFMNDSFRDDIVDLFPPGCGKCLVSGLMDPGLRLCSPFPVLHVPMFYVA